MSNIRNIKNALISVFHKDGLQPIINRLNDLGVKIYSTGGTEDFIKSQGVKVNRVEDLTSYPSILGGRVKTLHPKIHAGILSKRDLGDLIHNTRNTKGQSDKKNPQDFALWKKAKSNHIMKWGSPWSVGFPGWHIECTAMSNKYLGDLFDIHGGGIDLKFPHHECEIAQANACFGTNAANFWVHANMLTLNGAKMSKSTGNNILPNEIFSLGSSPP